jgi:CheY-like chemotaxis protein
VQPEVLDLNAVVGELEELLRRTIGENVDDLQTTFAPDLPLVKVDRGQIDQMVMNLALNARDAMPEGGTLELATSTFEADPRYAELHNIKAGTYVRLTVSDTGMGMTQEIADRAFDPFFTTKPRGKGTGLGLATVYGIATQAGGDVTMYSEVGLGTAVRVNLPATADDAAPLLEPLLEVSLSARGESVLLVEDEQLVREPAQRILESCGYTVLAASDAEEALAIVKERSGAIDLLITDVVMPGRSGRELALEVAELRPSTRVLFMSGYSHDVIEHQGIVDEGVTLIEKPFAADDLLRRVREVLDGEQT